MLVRRVHVRSGSRPSCHGRRGAGIPWFVITAPFLALVAIWVIHTASLYHRQAELEVAAEAAACAAAEQLADDILLTELNERQEFVEHRARMAGREIAKLNHVLGHPVQLRDNKNNDHTGELTIGTLIHPCSHDFDCSCHGFPSLYWPNRNAVRVALKRCGVAASATTLVDRDVLGFKIQGAMSLPGQSIPAIPVMPLALFTDPVFDHEGDDHSTHQERCASRDKRSWDFQVIARRGGDRFRFDRDRDGTFQNGRVRADERGDGIPEMRVTLRAEHNHHNNGQIALVGVENAREAADQLRTGITYQQLMSRDGRLLLGQDESGSTPRNELLLPRSNLTEDELDYLGERLNQIVGQPRVWMLYSHTLEQENSDGAVRVVGFVAARVMAVERDEHGGHKKSEHRSLEVVLQPCMLITATAVTDHRRRELGPRTLYNPYVCKIRLVE
jgi:hypothetical protein